MQIKPHTIAIVAAVFVFFILLSLAQEINRQWQVQSEVSRLESEVKQLQSSTIELQNLNQYFRTDDFQERLAREKLNYRAPGEQVVLIPEQDLSTSTGATAANTSESSTPIPRRWWEAFFGEKGYL